MSFNPSELNLTATADLSGGRLSFDDASLIATYWLPPGKRLVLAVSKVYRANGDELNPEWWTIKEVGDLEHLGVARLTFQGKAFSCRLEDLGLFKGQCHEDGERERALYEAFLDGDAIRLQVGLSCDLTTELTLHLRYRSSAC